ncbi:MAG: lytic transglycosylase domain-containing protein [Acidithiobacillus sp.]|uniref:lytic transglycosylase domain-containing protein n=1 Tax=Acidithiobacillus sp. TaxID=1872118 RepID=UPI003D08B1A3
MRALALGLILTALAAPAARADIYAYTDSNGVIHMTNMPQGNPQYRMVMRTPRMAVAAARASFNRQARERYQPLIEKAAARFGVSQALINAVISAESGYNAGAVSPKGAMGLMQLMPGTADRFGVGNAFSAQENIDGGTAYLAHLLRTFGGDLRLAIAAYNAGSQAVVQSGYHIPPYAETQNYVPRVLGFYQRYLAEGEGAAGQGRTGLIQVSSP